MSKVAQTAEIHVYYETQVETDEPYNVSRVDADGNEISCEASYETLSDAWKAGLEMAADYGVPCVEYATAVAVSTNQETDRWEPEQ